MTSTRDSWSARNIALLVGFAICFITLLASVFQQRWVTDDALISFRYVDNFVHGEGLVYNLGERLESFSSPLFVVLLAPFRLFGASSFVTAQVLGALFTVAELVLIFALLGRAGRWPVAAVLAGSLFATDRIVHVWATGGLETALYSLLLFASFSCSVRQCRGDTTPKTVTHASIVHLLLAMARPEGIAFYALYLAATVIGARHDGAWKRLVARSLIIVAGGVAALLALRYAYYGALLPHTYYAKLSGVPTSEFGRGYLYAFAQREGFVNAHVLAWLVPLGVCVASIIIARRTSPPNPEQHEEQRGLAVVALIGAAYVALGLALITREGGDYMSDFRFMRPLIGILFVSAAALVGHGFSTRASLPLQLFSVAAAIALLISHGARQLDPAPVFSDAPSPPEHKLNNSVTAAQAARFCAALELVTYPGDKILTDVTGYKGYGHELYTVDATGLTSPDLEDNFYLRPMWATPTYRDRLPGHARWPKVEFMTAQGFALITPKISADGHDVAEITDRSHRRYRRYRYLHVTVALESGEFLRFFTTLSADQLAERAEARGLDLCWRAPKQDQAVCARSIAAARHAEHAERDERPTQPPGIEATERIVAQTAQDAAKQYFGAMRSADCEWLRATTGGIQAQRDTHSTCQQLSEELEHMAPVRLWEIEWERPARTTNERLLQVKFFIEGKDRVKVMRVAEIDGEWRVTRL